jgi:hypothetical protein
MAITTVSTTDSSGAEGATSDLAQKEEVQDTKSASAQEAVETPEDSETSETEDSEAKAGEDDSSAEEIEAKEGDKPKKKNGYKKKINKLNKELSATKQETEYWKQEALKSQKASPQETKPVETQKTISLDARPKSEDFGTHEEYVEALTEWKVEKKLKDKEIEARALDMKKENESKVTTFKEREAAFKAEHTDFNDVLDEIEDVLLPPILQREIVTSENGPQLMYELAKDREELERICKLPPEALLRALGRFEAAISKDSESSPETKKTTKAPKPIAPVGASSSGSTKKSISDPNLSQREYEQLRAKQRSQGSAGLR